MTDASGQLGPEGERKKRQPADMARLVGALIAVVILVAFIVDNSQTVKVGFVFFHADMSLIWALIIAAVLGIIIDRLVIYRGRRRRRRAAKAAGDR